MEKKSRKNNNRVSFGFYVFEGKKTENPRLFQEIKEIEKTLKQFKDNNKNKKLNKTIILKKLFFDGLGIDSNLQEIDIVNLFHLQIKAKLQEKKFIENLQETTTKQTTKTKLIKELKIAKENKDNNKINEIVNQLVGL